MMPHRSPIAIADVGTDFLTARAKKLDIPR
jgi:hypothetical protein